MDPQLSREMPYHHDAADVVHGGFASTAVHAPYMALPLAGLFVSASILVIYGHRGIRIVTSVLVYLAALSMMKLSVKWVFLTSAFQFPKFLSFLHFLTGAGFTALVLGARREALPRPSVSEFWLTIFPISVAMVLSIGSNNMALVSVSAAFTEVVGATNCLITIALVLLLGLPFDRVLILPVSVVAIGCSISTLGELNFSSLGLMLCLLSNVCRSVKVTLQQKLLTGETRNKFDPCALLFWISIPCSAVMFVLSLLTEGIAPYSRITGCTHGEMSSLLLAIVVSCANAGILNLAQLFVTKDLGAVGSQLVAQAKTVLTVLGGMVFFGEVMTMLEIFGFTLALAGVATFSWLEHAGKEKRKAADSGDTVAKS